MMMDYNILSNEQLVSLLIGTSQMVEYIENHPKKTASLQKKRESQIRVGRQDINNIRLEILRRMNGGA